MLDLPVLISSIHWTSMSSNFFNSVSFPFPKYYGAGALIAPLRRVLLPLFPVSIALFALVSLLV
jgi:hypothetical protein